MTAIAPFLDDGHVELAARAAEVATALAGEHDPRAIVRSLGESGLLGWCVPAKFGGARDVVDARALCVIREALARTSPLADTMFAMQGLGSFPLVHAGSDEQRGQVLAAVATGETICAFAITEPDAGSDVAAVATRATPSAGGYALDGTKAFISNAGLADSIVVFARTADTGAKGLSAFLVRAPATGIEARPVELIADHPIGELRFAAHFVPSARRIGDEGDGFRIAMATLDRFRPTVGAAAVGMAQRALDEAVARAKSRRQFGKALAEQQATQMALAEMAVELDAARLLVYAAAWKVDHGERATREAAEAKYFATEAAFRIVDRALQLHGGAGLVRGSVVERLYRDVRALRIYEGTSEIQKLVIAREVLRT